MAVCASPACEIRGLRTRIRRPQCERGACKEKKNDKTCFSITSPDPVFHASTPPGYDFFPAHRLPPFNEFTLISSSNELPIEGKTLGRLSSVAGSLNSTFTGMNFDNVTLNPFPPPFDFRGKSTQQIDKTIQCFLRCPLARRTK
jgi:hypothetical protein